ncbi:MAG: hypothetical protein M3M91_01890 [Thermoproteota archaeon]|nr:hypothetical protein [Thermoproteota archaeon]
MTTRLAKALAIAALILFLISGVDVATNAPGGGDLLPLSSMVRGMIFGFGAVALATAAFFVSVKRESSLVSILLIVTGTLMVIAGVVSTRGLTLIWFPGPIIFLFLGFWIIALGIVKNVRTRHQRIIFHKSWEE